ncbi:MAG: methylenetetrahydrofolate reductase [Desulfobacterales bacterium]|nr:MAG: methylenetetrahydrofolate reductase [Desulfobacterales bacterium]
MENDSQLASQIEAGSFIVTAEYLPKPSADSSAVEKVKRFFNSGLTAVNVADNPHGPVMSSLAGSVALKRLGIEPVYQIVTRDRNRIAIQSDLLGAVSLGIRNVLCLSGYHQALTLSPESSNVYDIDSIQLIAAVKKMNAEGILLNGTQIEGRFPVLVGAAANPDLKPMELNIIRLVKKVAAGATFIQTQAVFDIDAFQQWIEAARKEGITEQTAILAGVMPIEGVTEAERLKEKYTDFSALGKVVERMKQVGDEDAQKKEGLAICAETVKRIKGIKGLRGIHIISGGKEAVVPDVINAAGL